MTFTIHLGLWIVPVIITLLSLFLILAMAYSERHDSGFLSGFGTLLLSMVCVPATLVAWVLWGLSFFFK